jgi:hypothetical protein
MSFGPADHTTDCPRRRDASAWRRSSSRLRRYCAGFSDDALNGGASRPHEAGRETALNASAGAAPWHTNERADLPARTRGRAWIVVPICVKALLKLPNLRYAEGGEDAIHYEGPFPDRMMLYFDAAR